MMFFGVIICSKLAPAACGLWWSNRQGQHCRKRWFVKFQGSWPSAVNVIEHTRAPYSYTNTAYTHFYIGYMHMQAYTDMKESWQKHETHTHCEQQGDMKTEQCRSASIIRWQEQSIKLSRISLLSEIYQRIWFRRNKRLSCHLWASNRLQGAGGRAVPQPVTGSMLPPMRALEMCVWWDAVTHSGSQGAHSCH